MSSTRLDGHGRGASGARHRTRAPDPCRCRRGDDLGPPARRIAELLWSFTDVEPAAGAMFAVVGTPNSASAADASRELKTLFVVGAALLLGAFAAPWWWRRRPSHGPCAACAIDCGASVTVTSPHGPASPPRPRARRGRPRHRRHGGQPRTACQSLRIATEERHRLLDELLTVQDESVAGSPRTSTTTRSRR